MGYPRRGDLPPVEIIGHRGSPRRFRENTLPSFAQAFAEGADAVELDVHGTADGTVVVHHDAVTNARPGDSGEAVTISATPIETLRAVRVGGEAIPTLEEVFTLVPVAATVYVEVKGRGIEHAVVAAIRASGRPCAVHSFDHRIPKRVRDLAPEIPVGILQTSYPVDPVRPMRDAAARDLWQHWESIDEPLVETVHANGGRVIAWTVNDVDVARRLIGRGVDGICTDVPASLRALAGELVHR